MRIGISIFFSLARAVTEGAIGYSTICQIRSGNVDFDELIFGVEGVKEFLYFFGESRAIYRQSM